MSPQVIAGLVVVATILAWAGFMAYVVLGKKRPEEQFAEEPSQELVAARAVSGAPGYVVELEVPEPAPRPRRVEEDVRGVTRRKFLNLAWFTALGIGTLNLTLASLDFMWPRLRGGFGAKITVDLSLDELRNFFDQRKEPYFVSDGRFFISFFQGDSEQAADIPAYKLSNTPETGVMALYRKCPHLGCSVPWCNPSQWFECPCHGSKYSVNGEYRDGPAPRGLDRFPVEVRGQQVIVDTSSLITGPPRGTVTGQPQPEGENCVTVASE